MNIKNNMTQIRRWTGIFSIALVIISIALLSVRGLNLGLDFTGGMVSEFRLSPDVSQTELTQSLSPVVGDSLSIVKGGELGRWTLRYSSESHATLDQVKSTLAELDTHAEVISSSMIGAQVGDELFDQGGMAILVSMLCIMGYLCFRFEWRLASGALLALFHDVIVVLGFFALTQQEFNLTVFAALLAILGYSLNDSIIIADRIREQILAKLDWKTSDVINSAVISTFSRTMVTSGTTLVTVGALWLMGGAPLQGFASAMFIGIVSGTWSSISIATVLPEMCELKAEHYIPAEIDSNP
ncbi:putative SecD/SecF/SecDF export membrane protein [Vibrio nigripulchritudo MADA3029]|uniref:protein translocase subunit SecF n=1 Tax=Vibrio nigripulchritudo TaxID=28173 RepID=UPI0003B19792|nr:protein translocase subunit SecF [Vibrio nigripulchritudo]CCN49020.1 putative SecD/SecF/SecDF export membrane protein [Vibrio nigripulchritudo MADA3020]CCN56211.1 putative SecD/SecF/SecDF export membrane protein [Vibrio nigripulchritudo MADA3021]CCN59145.1 putative SecD/SecF/SecDF export membrane protein [Vibrio nigripulchritudo MADA3029]